MTLCFEIGYIHEMWLSLMELAFLLGMGLDYIEGFLWEPDYDLELKELPE